MIGENARSTLQVLCQAGTPQATYEEEAWSLFESESVRWRATAHLCGLTDVDFFIWCINPLEIAQKNVSDKDQDALNLIRSLGTQTGIIWFLEAPRITSIEIFSAQHKVKQALSTAQFKSSASIATILPRKTPTDVIKHLDQLFEADKKEKENQIEKHLLESEGKTKETQSQTVQNKVQSEESQSNSSLLSQSISPLPSSVIPISERQWPRRYIDAFVPIPKGQFLGAEGKEWEIKHPFFLGQTSVTQSLYQSVMQEPTPIPLGAHYPVVKISWLDCLRFCNRLSQLQDLPSFYEIK